MTQINFNPGRDRAADAAGGGFRAVPPPRVHEGIGNALQAAFPAERCGPAPKLEGLLARLP